MNVRWSGDGDEAALGPLAQLANVLGARDGQRHGRLELREQRRGARTAACAASARSAPAITACSISAPEKPSRRRRQRGEVEARRRPRCAGPGGSRRICSRSALGREVDEEDLVEAPLAQQLRRQARDVVGGGDDEHVGALLLQPGQERAEQPLGDAAVGVAAEARAPSRSRRATARTAPATPRCRSRGAGSSPSPPRTCRRGAPASSLTSGSCHWRATNFAASDLPQPCTPTSSRPPGAGRFIAAASGVRASAARSSHDRKPAKPPSSVGLSCGGEELEQPFVAERRGLQARRPAPRPRHSKPRRRSRRARASCRAWLIVSPAERRARAVVVVGRQRDGGAAGRAAATRPTAATTSL